MPKRNRKNTRQLRVPSSLADKLDRVKLAQGRRLTYGQVIELLLKWVDPQRLKSL